MEDDSFTHSVILFLALMETKVLLILLIEATQFL
jgi:hypothetical protein